MKKSAAFAAAIGLAGCIATGHSAKQEPKRPEWYRSTDRLCGLASWKESPRCRALADLSKCPEDALHVDTPACRHALAKSTAEFNQREANYIWSRAYVGAIEKQVSPLTCKFPLRALRGLEIVRRNITLKTTRKETKATVMRVLLRWGDCLVNDGKSKAAVNNAIWL